MDELSSVIQLIELEGKLAKTFGKGLLLLGKGAVKGGKKISNYAKIKHMQNLLKIHYASIGTDRSMALSDVEKLTGGNYQILNVPTEDREILTSLYNDLKSRNIPFAEMPDLEVGDGFVQLAVDPQDSNKIKAVLEIYREKIGEAEILTLEEYRNMNPEQLDALAKEGYDLEAKAEVLENIQKRNISPEYRPVSINLESLVLKENKTEFLLRTPMKGSPKGYAFRVKKKDMVFLDKEKTLFTHFRLDETYTVHTFSFADGVGEQISVSGQELGEFFAIPDKETIQRASKVSLKEESAFANFNEAKSAETSDVADVSLPEYTKEQGKEALDYKNDISPEKKQEPMEQLKDILQVENQKEHLQSGEYLSITVEEYPHLLIEEGKNSYTVKIPDKDAVNSETVLLAEFKKEDVMVDKEKKRMNVQLKQNGNTRVHVFNSKGERKRELRLDNDFIAGAFNKADVGKSMEKNLNRIKKQSSKVVKNR